MDTTAQTAPPPKSYDDVTQEWQSWKAEHPSHVMPLEDYAKTADMAEGTTARSAAYRGENDIPTKLSNWLGGVSKDIANVPLGLTTVAGTPSREAMDYAQSVISGKPSTVPEGSSMAGIGRAVGGAVGKPFGLAPQFAQAGQSVAEGAPRLTADIAAGGAPLIADFGLQGYAGAREKGASIPRSIAAGGISAGAGALTGPAEKVGAGLAAKGLARTPLANETAQRLGEFLSGQAAIGGTMAAGQTGQDVAAGDSVGKAVSQQLTPENIFSSLAQQVPFGIMGIHNITDRPAAVTPEGALVSYPSRTALEQVKLGLAKGAPNPESALGQQFTAGATPTDGSVVSSTGGVNPNLSPEQQAKDTFQKEAFPLEDFSLTQNIPGHTVNFGSVRQMTPTVILDKIMAGEIRPTNAPDNQGNVQMVSQLQQAFADPQAGYADMNKLAQGAELANLQQKGIPLSQEQQRAWSIMSPAEQQGSHVAAKVLNDPYATLGANTSSSDPETRGGLDPRRWEIDPDSTDTYLRSIYRASANMMEKWDRPITTVEDAAALVRDVDGFTKNVKGMLEQNGFSQELQAQMTREGVFTPITQDSLSAKYKNFMADYLNNPSAETAARSLQWVKNQVWIAANQAKEVMLSKGSYSDPEVGATNKQSAADTALEQRYQGAASKVPELQDVLTKQYLAARAETPSIRKGEAEPMWRLDNYRRGVSDAMDQLTPEQIDSLKAVAPHEPTSKDEKYDDTAFREAASRIPVKQTNDEGGSFRTNLGRIMFEPKSGRVYGGSARREVESETAQQNATAPAQQAEPSASNLSAVIAKNFTGTPQDPGDVIRNMSPIDLQASVSGTLGDNAWKRLMNQAAVLKKPGQAPLDWAKDFLTVQASGDDTAKKAWLAANPVGSSRKFADVERQLLGKDQEAGLMWKAASMGLTPNEGVTAKSLRGEPESAPQRKINPQTKKDFLNVITEDLLDRGYQPEVANTIARFTDKIADQFYWLDNVDFAKLADRNGAVQELYKNLKVLGLHLPDQTMINGKPTQNHVIALMQQDLVDRAGYAPLNTFWKLTAFAHEAFHVLQDNVVNNKFLGHTNEDTQTVIDSVNSMHAAAANMTPEDRAMSAGSLVDMMIPPKYTRGENGRFLPEVQGLINAASQNPREYSAFMFQMATAGIGSKLADFAKGTNVAQAGRIVNDFRDYMSWFSQDTNAFMRGQFRYVGDFLDVLQRTLDDPTFRKEHGLTYTTKETRNVQPNLEEGDVVSSETHDLTSGQSTTSTEPYQQDPSRTAPAAIPRTKDVKATFTTPPTAGVGATTRAMAEAALRIAKTGEGTGQQYTGQAPVEPNFDNVMRRLAQINPKVERAVSTIKQLVSNLSGQGVKTVNLSDVKAAKDFMASIGAPPPTGTTPFSSVADAFFDPQNKWTDRAKMTWLMRYISPTQYNTADLQRRGIDVAELSRQNTDKVGANAHVIAQNMRAPIVTRVGALGKYGLDTQTNYYRFLHDGEGNFDPQANIAMAKILRAQQERAGVDAADPWMQGVVKNAVKGLSPDKQLMAVSAVKDVNEIYSNAMASHIKSSEEHQVAVAAHTAMLMDPGKFKSADAKGIGTIAMKAASGDLGARQQLVGLVQKGMISPESLSAIEAVGVSGWESTQNLRNIAANNGNFASEQRFGRYVLFYKDAQSGKIGSQGLESPEALRDFGAAREKEGASGFRIVDKRSLNPEQLQFMGSPDVIDQVKKVIQGNFDKQLQAIINADPVNGPGVAKALTASFHPNGEVDNYTLTGSLERMMKQRKLAPGREFINPVANMEEYVGTSARAIARRQARDNHALYMTELKQMGLTDLAKDLDAHFQERLQPTSENTTKLTTIGSAMMIGGDITRSTIDSTLGFTLGIPELMHDGASVAGAHSYYMKGMAGTVKNLSSKSEFNASADRGQKLESTPVGTTRQLTPDAKRDTINFYLRRMNDENRLSRAPILDTLEKDAENMNLEQMSKVGEFKTSSPKDMILNPIYSVARTLLMAHAFLPNFNQKISAHAALEYKYDQGMRGEDLYRGASTLLDTMTAAAGRGNKPVGYAYAAGSGTGSEARRSAVSYATMMQQYGLSQTFGLAHMFRDAFSTTPGLTMKQRQDSLRGATYGLSTLTALAGALGVTGVQYAFGAINSILHKDPEAMTREGLQKFYNTFIDSDQEHGSMFADTTMNGLVNRLTGLDIASRAGVSSLFGISPGEGGSFWDLAGPNAGIIEQLVRGVSDTAAGKPWLGLKDISPRALKPLIEMTGNYKQFGDLRINDQNNNLIMQPNAAQAIGYALGAAPARVREERQESRLMTTAQDNYQIQREAQINQYARGLLNGDTQPLLQEAYSRQYEVGFNPRNFVDSVIERALDMQTQKDPMTRGSVLNAQSQDAIGSTFDNPRMSELGRLAMKTQMLSQVGMPFGMQTPSSQDYLKAQMVDQLRQQRGMGRSEALAWIQRYYGL